MSRYARSCRRPRVCAIPVRERLAQERQSCRRATHAPAEKRESVDSFTSRALPVLAGPGPLLCCLSTSASSRIRGRGRDGHGSARRTAHSRSRIASSTPTMIPTNDRQGHWRASFSLVRERVLRHLEQRDGDGAVPAIGPTSARRPEPPRRRRRPVDWPLHVRRQVRRKHMQDGRRAPFARLSPPLRGLYAAQSTHSPG